MKVLITGANGFLGKNLQLRLLAREEVEVLCFTRDDSLSELTRLVRDVDVVFHLAGVNRPKTDQEFVTGNVDLTSALCAAVAAEITRSGKKPAIIYSSSTQAAKSNLYGSSKRAAEALLESLAAEQGTRVHLFRLPNVFGKWCKPNYNSAVATFCNNIARGLPIQVNDPAAVLTMVYVDDVLTRFIQLMDGAGSMQDDDGFERINPTYTSTVGEIAQQIQAFKDSRSTLLTERVGTGLARALYSTYVSYLPVESFAYPVPQHGDPRGVFVEMLKTPDSGQFSFFTAHPGITRGGHYHHTKTEKFLVIKGQARFKFRHMQTGETHTLVTVGDKAEVVETVPGWTHDITNIGEDEMIVMLWANEIFDRANPDTYACPV